MDISTALQTSDTYNIKNYCHINTNEDGDRFVGVKADSSGAKVYFPIGYQLPETDEEIRTDIKNLIYVLSEFTNKEDRLIASNRFATPQNVDFPINAYRNVIEYYFSVGGNYYVESDSIYKTGNSGVQHWGKTFRNQTPLIQKSETGAVSLIYTNFTVRTTTPNDNKIITQINKMCVYEAFSKIGWLYVSFLPEKPTLQLDYNFCLQTLRKKLDSTNDDKKRTLFSSMLEMLEYIGVKTSEHDFYYGTDNFDYVWEKLIDRAFGERNKDKFFPRTRWLLDYGKQKEKHPLMPDSIMIYNDKYYVLDAKYYRYGCTGNPDHLPNASSISKQITYGEYIEKNMGINNDSLFNAFIMPYNMNHNYFGLTTPIGVIGEAVSDWKTNKLNYERIQGIVIDTRYLMYHYVGNPIKSKIALSDCIEGVLKRNEISKS